MCLLIDKRVWCSLMKLVLRCFLQVSNRWKCLCTIAYIRAQNKLVVEYQQ